MHFSHVFVTRPLQESKELATMLAPLNLQVLVQPAFDFREKDIKVEQPDLLLNIESQDTTHLLIFTSPRAVTYGLAQLPAEALTKNRVAAIGPATANALETAGIFVNIRPSSGFTSEALLDTIKNDSSGSHSSQKSAVILAAEGGRRKTEDGLIELGWEVQKLLVYSRVNTQLDKKALESLKEATGILSVWTSANTMNALSKRLPPATWFQICGGEWLVISERLRRIARAYSPSQIHLAKGPGNNDLAAAIRLLGNSSG